MNEGKMFTENHKNNHLICIYINPLAVSKTAFMKQAYIHCTGNLL